MRSGTRQHSRQSLLRWGERSGGDSDLRAARKRRIIRRHNEAVVTQPEGAGNTAAANEAPSSPGPSMRLATEHEISPRALRASEQENVQSRLRSAAQSARAEDSPVRNRIRTISKGKAGPEPPVILYQTAFEVRVF